MAQDTATELLPAEGQSTVSLATALKQWLGLVLQEYQEDGPAGSGLFRFAHYLVKSITAGSTEAIGGLTHLALYCWGDGAPMGYGNGPNCRLEREEERITFFWEGTFTHGRQIEWTVHDLRDDIVEVRWTSGTGRPSRFITSVLRGK